MTGLADDGEQVVVSWSAKVASAATGQHIGSETVHVVAWLGPHHTEGGADESGYEFSWSELREPVIDVVTGAGWTYKPKKA